MTRQSKTMNVRIALLVALLVAANIFLGFTLARESQNALATQVHSRMTDLACTAAALLNGDELATLKAEDINTPAYQKALATLDAFDDNVDVSYIYCVRERPDGTFEFTIDPTPDAPAYFGEDVVRTDALVEASKGTVTVDLEPYRDRWGRFYSAYCPVFDSHGKVTGIVGCDFDADWYDERVATGYRIAVINCIASLVLALIALIMLARMSRSETKHLESLNKASRYDPLTGLANMGYFITLAEDSYQEMKAAGQEPAMLFMDLANMKFFNQKWGFAEGDKLMKAFADLLAKHFGHQRCSRFGQDHFTVSTNAENLDARLDAFLEELESINNGRYTAVHIGIFPASMVDEDDIHGLAACDCAKMACDELQLNPASACRYFDEDLRERLQRRQYVIDNIDRAIAEGWIHVHYQPIVRTATGKVCDEEALARWYDPERGLLSPIEFVPVLEDAKLAYKLDLYVLEQTLEKMHVMADAGLYVVPASINLSRSDFESCDIVEEVRTRVDAAGIERDKVNVEITETSLVKDFEFMRNQVDRFHELGFKVWMDDFGSEYSSLDYLQRLQFDLIKLDMHFMRQFDNGDRTKIILVELVKMALGLGIDTVCEGVETAEQVKFLREVGCSMVQGFYFTKPLPLEDILLRYQNGTAIGFENPAESDYYSELGRINLYDLASVSRKDDDDPKEDGLNEYFNTLPMAVAEVTDEGFAIMRCNESYRKFVENVIGDGRIGTQIPYSQINEADSNPFISALCACGKEGGRLSVDETIPSGKTIHAFVRRVSVNPTTHAAGIAIAVLAIS